MKVVVMMMMAAMRVMTKKCYAVHTQVLTGQKSPNLRSFQFSLLELLKTYSCCCLLIDHNWPFYLGTGCIFHEPAHLGMFEDIKQAFDQLATSSRPACQRLLLGSLSLSLSLFGFVCQLMTLSLFWSYFDARPISLSTWKGRYKFFKKSTKVIWSKIYLSGNNWRCSDLIPACNPYIKEAAGSTMLMQKCHFFSNWHAMQ